MSAALWLLCQTDQEEGSAQDVPHPVLCLLTGASINTSQAALHCQCYSDPLSLCHTTGRVAQRETRTHRQSQMIISAARRKTCAWMEWKQTRNRRIIYTLFQPLVSYSIEGPVVVCFVEVARVTGDLEGRKLSFEADMTLLDCTGARISGCWSLRSDRR